MSYKIYNGTTLLATIATKSYTVTGLSPATSYTLDVVPNNGLRDGTKASVTFKTRGVQLIIPETLTAGATVSLRYQEYSLGLVAIGSEPSGMFGGGNQKTLAATVISSSGGSSVVELTTSDTSFADQTALTMQADGTYAAFNGYHAIYFGGGGVTPT
ncbi:MAG: fibronectin type III domain-containing protein [Lactobacillus sp.]|nr:MAG: fibronectin type III domain-containing protein [Lactobacillus sp.]